MELLLALLGGVSIGLAAVAVLAFQGQVAGITGILAGALAPPGAAGGWRWGFLGGLVAGGLLAFAVAPEAFHDGPERSLGALGAAGLLVGFGTRLGGGCTSGHGVCGIGRLSGRSLVATVTFIAAGALTVLVVQRLLGGTL